MTPCYLFAGGGTGGHLFPGLAVAEELRRRQSGCEIVFAGSEREVERRILAEAAVEHVSLSAEPLALLKRRPLRFILRNWSAWREARRIIDSRLPSAIIGLGGFASVPLVLAARERSVPTFLLEQNVLAGGANRWLARRAQGVCVSFPATESDLPRGSRVIVTGNPVRPSIAELAGRPALSDDASTAAPMLLILGGSQGARAVNDGVLAAAPRLKPLLGEWRIVHQTGAADESRVASAYADAGLAAEARAFFTDMAPLYRRASLAISRAGATTLAELACAGVPAILVPFPSAARDHQSLNAETFAAAGAALVAAETSPKDAFHFALETALESLCRDAARRLAMRTAMQGLARPDAAARVAELVAAGSLSR